MEQIQKPSFIQRLKNRWGIIHNWEIVVILCVFSVTGSLSVKIGKPILQYLNITQESQSAWVYWPVRIVISFIAYQIMLVTIGTICGQHRFFWNMEKKMLSRFGMKFKD